MEVQINYGVVIFNQISKWFKDVKKRKKDGKPLPKMFYRRFISIMLKKKMRKHIEEKDKEALNVNKKITKKLFKNWKRNPVELNQSKQSEESEKIITEVQKPTKKEKKRKLVEDEQEESQGSIMPKTYVNVASTVEKLKKNIMKMTLIHSKAKKHNLKKSKKQKAPKDSQEGPIAKGKSNVSQNRESEKEKESMVAKVLGDLASKTTQKGKRIRKFT